MAQDSTYKAAHADKTDRLKGDLGYGSDKGAGPARKVDVGLDKVKGLAANKMKAEPKPETYR
jgi:hypothetical protein